METFLEMFGGVSVTIAQLVGIGVIIFSVCGSGKKVMEYFSEKKKGIIEKAQAQRDKDDEWQRIANQVAQYPQWHEQSIQIRDDLAKSINELNTKIDETNKTLADMKRQNRQDYATTRRYRIIRFNDELLQKGDREILHTKEHFDQIIEDVEKYESYCDYCEKNDPEFQNGKARAAIENIRRVYAECMHNKTFL